jgi:hypothetical protein
MLRLISVMVCGLFLACGQSNPTCTKGDHCVHYLAGLPGTGGNGGGGGSSGVGPDMAKAPAGDMAKASSADMASSSTDMAMASTDMAMSCVATGGDCTFHNDAICCSGYCIYSSNTCR